MQGIPQGTIPNGQLLLLLLLLVIPNEEFQKLQQAFAFCSDILTMLQGTKLQNGCPCSL